jgi:hypothetical protein
LNVNNILFGAAAGALVFAGMTLAARAWADPDEPVLTSADNQTIPLSKFQQKVCDGLFQTEYCLQLVAAAPENFWLGGTPLDDQRVIAANGKTVRLGDLQHAVCDKKVGTEPFAQCAKPIADSPWAFFPDSGRVN